MSANNDHRQKQILVVDDEAINRFILIKMFETIGCHALSAKDGPEALQMFETDQFDIVVIDYYMPNINGIELAKKVRNISVEREQDVLLVMTTAIDSKDCLISDILMSDIDRIFLKPIDFAEMRTIANSKQRKTLTHLST